jgi:hypothetical protein
MHPASSAAPPPAAKLPLIVIVGAPGSGRAQLASALRAALQGRVQVLAEDDAPACPIGLCLLNRSATPGDPTDARLRLALLHSGQDFCVLAGTPQSRLDAALAAWAARQRERPVDQRASRWRHACGRCGDGDCERHLFDQLPRPR